MGGMVECISINIFFWSIYWMTQSLKLLWHFRPVCYTSFLQVSGLSVSLPASTLSKPRASRLLQHYLSPSSSQCRTWHNNNLKTKKNPPPWKIYWWRSPSKKYRYNLVHDSINKSRLGHSQPSAPRIMHPYLVANKKWNSIFEWYYIVRRPGVIDSVVASFFKQKGEIRSLILSHLFPLWPQPAEPLVCWQKSMGGWDYLWIMQSNRRWNGTNGITASTNNHQWIRILYFPGHVQQVDGGDEEGIYVIRFSPKICHAKAFFGFFCRR